MGTNAMFAYYTILPGENFSEKCFTLLSVKEELDA